MHRLLFATSVFHSYAHDLVCQLIHSPKWIEFFGLSDGEGTERLWSFAQSCIGQSRHSGRLTRKYNLDNRVGVLNEHILLDLRALGALMSSAILSQCS
jgi:hypothetical protein